MAGDQAHAAVRVLPPRGAHRTASPPVTPASTVPSSASQSLAARLVARAGLTAGAMAGDVSVRDTAAVQDSKETTSEALARAERLWEVLGAALDAWCGPFAYHALLTRALAQARPTHLPLAALRVTLPAAPQLEGLGVIAAAGGDVAIADATQTLLVALIDLLTSVIGEQMALDTVSRALETFPAVPAGGPRPKDDEAAS